jgi:hypothetical protein
MTITTSISPYNLTLKFSTLVLKASPNGFYNKIKLSLNLRVNLINNIYDSN